MKNAKIMGGLFLSAFMTCILAACSSSGSISSTEASSTSEPAYDWGHISDTTITIWGDSVSLQREYYKKAFERYEEMTGNTIETKGYSIEEFEENRARIKAGTLERPDILISQGGTNLDPYDPETNFYDFTDAPWVDDLTNIAVNQTIYNGKVIGLPHAEASISGTLYNKQIFEKCGLDLPENQDEFMEVCEALKQKGYTPMYFPYADLFFFYQFPMDSIVADEATLNALNDFSLSYADIPEMEKIISWYKVMADKGYFGDNYMENMAAGRAEAMQSGKYAMMLGWDVWLYTDLKQDAEKFGLMPAFVGTPENGSFEGPNLALLTVNKNSPRLDAALDLITFMADPYNYNVAFEGLYTAPVFKHQVKSISTPQYVETEQLIEKLYYDAGARLRIRGFSLSDATYIQKYMQDPSYTAEQCLTDMNNERIKRGMNSKQLP